MPDTILMLKMLADILITRLHSRLGLTSTKLLGMELSLMVRTGMEHFAECSFSHLGMF